VRSRRRAALTPVLAATLAFGGCAHEVVWLGDPAPELESPLVRSPLTVGVVAGEFSKSRLDPRGVLDRFASDLRSAALFEGIMYPVPPGVEPTWEIRLTASDSAVEPTANLWWSALASAVPPAALFVTLRSEYTLELEALVVRERTLVTTYRAQAAIQNRWQPYANTAEAGANGVQVAVSGATREILAALSRDLPRLAEADRPYVPGSSMHPWEHEQ
jgi:hypothetical protein